VIEPNDDRRNCLPPPLEETTLRAPACQARGASSEGAITLAEALRRLSGGCLVRGGEGSGTTRWLLLVRCPILDELRTVYRIVRKPISRPIVQPAVRKISR
jgi:hypothetical protein